MNRYFSSSARALLKWAGYPLKSLPLVWQYASETYTGRGAINKVGKIEKIEILHRKDGTTPVHKSHYNRKDQADIISVRITPVDGWPKTHHIYEDGTGTMSVGDERE